MDSNQILFEQYKIYTQQKENFVERSFFTNKFYLILVLAFILVMFIFKDVSLVFGISLNLVFSTIGMAICTFWWINVDSYNFLIKVKLGKVIEEIEKNLPIQPYTQEFLAIKDLRKNKKEFLFADMQKSLATFLLLLFFVIFANELLAVIINYL